MGKTFKLSQTNGAFFTSRNQHPNLFIRKSRTWILAFALSLGWLNASAQSGSLDQVRNGSASSPNNPGVWANGNAGSSNSHYIESMSVAYRYVMTGMPTGAHYVIIEYDIKKGTSHAIDYLTHYQRLDPHDQFSHPAEVINPLIGVAGVDPTPIHYPIPAPPSNKTVTCTGLSQPATSFNALPASERMMTLFGGSAITSISYVNTPNLNQPDGYQQIRVDFTTSSPTVVLAWGGHLAAAADWCPEFSAAGISGSPYHMRVDALNGSGGGGDMSLSAAAVIPIPPCGITGDESACPGQVLSYSLDPYIGYNYTWSITDNTSGASIAGSNTGTSINVNTGSSAGNYTVQVVMSTTGYTGTCIKAVSVGAPSLSESHVNYSCSTNAGSIDLSVSGGFPGYSYQWSNGQTTQDLSGLAAGTYTVTVQDQVGCSASLSVNITAQTALSASAAATAVSCHGGSDGAAATSVSGGTAPYSYLWSNGATTSGLSGLSAGTYTFTVTDANGCSQSSSASIGQPASALSGSLTTSGNVSCFGGSDGSIDVTASGGTAPYSYAWNNGATTQDISGLSAGSYSLVITDDNGCTFAMSAITIGQPAAALSATAGSSVDVSCFGGHDGSINLSVSGGTQPYAYSWSNGATSEDVSGLPAGSYSVVITDANGCTTELNSLVIGQPAAALSAAASSTSNVLCNGGSSGSIQLSVSGGTLPYSFVWSNGATSEDISGLSAGTYDVTVTDANGCVANAAGITISEPAAALAAGAIPADVNCHGDATGAIDLTVSGGTAPYAYQWSSGENSQDLNNITAGNYSVTVTDANGCTTAQASITVSQPAAPLTGNATTTQNVSCNSGANGAITLSVSGGTPGYTYSWSNGGTTQDISGLNAGTYVVTITDANGCTSNTSSTVSQPAGSLNSSISASQDVSCNGGTNGSINLAVAGGTTPYSYNWSTGATSQNIAGLSAGTYTVTIADANGCLNILSGVISQPAAPLSTSVSASSDVSCFGGSDGNIDLTVSGGTAPYSYQWNSGATSQDIFGLSAGSYSVVVTDANGCTIAQSSIIVSEPAAALNGIASASSAVSCYGGNDGAVSLNVSGGTAPYTYQWNNGSASQNISGLATGSYTVSITDANGCTASAQASVSQPSAALSASTTASQQVSCFGGDDGAIDLTVSGGTAPYSFQWSNNDNSEDISGLSTGVYTVLITDANGCTYSASQSVSQPAGALSVTIGVSQAVSCFGGVDGSIDLGVTQGTPPYSYSWSNGASSEDLNSLSAGSYSVTVTDANGCTAIASATVTQPAGALTASINTTQNVSCHSGADGAIDLEVTQGTAPYNFSWSNGISTKDLSNLAAGTYTVLVTDANGCTTTASATITQPAGALSASATTTQQVSCHGGANGSIDLTVAQGTAPYTFNWSTGANTEDLSGLATGTYTVTITDANGCSTIATGSVSQPAAALQASVSSSQNVFCHGGANGFIDLTVTGGTYPYIYAWSNGETSEDVSGLSAGNYAVTITDANGCTFSQIASITEPVASLSTSTSVTSNISCFSGNNGAIDLTASGGTQPYTYLWSTGSTQEDLSGVSAGTYTVTVTDANGCTSSSTETIQQPAGALATSLSATQQVSCYSGANGSANLTVTGGTQPYSYTWSNGANTEDVSGLAAGTYTVTIVDVNGCNATASVTITQPAGALNAGATASQNVSCHAGSDGHIDLQVVDGTPPYAFSWSNGQTSQNITGLASGTYTVTVTDANGCVTTAAATVTQPAAALNAGLSVSQQVSCHAGNNGSIDLTVSDGTAPYTFSWNTGANTEDISGLAAGSYTVTVTDANGCTAEQTASVTQPAAALSASASVSQQVNCHAGNDGSIDLTVGDGTAPYTFAWSTGANTEDIGNLAAGTYTVTVTDANGCVTTATATVTQPAAELNAFAATSQNVNCHAGSDGSIDLTVTNGTPPYTYNWSTGATAQDITGLTSGTYTVTVTDANGCTIVETGTVSQPAAALNAGVASSQDVFCHGGANGFIDLTVAGGTIPYTFAWSNGVTTEDISNLAAGAYTVTITDANGCTFTQIASIGQPVAPLTSSATVTANISCFSGNNGAIDLTASGGTQPYSFLWSTGSTLEDLSGISAGTYTVTITDINGCTSSVTATIQQPAGALASSVSATQQVSCHSGANGAANLTVNGGTLPYTYTWSNGDTTEDISGLSAGTYTVTILDVNGCNSMATVTITQPAAALNASAAVTQQVNCHAGVDGSIDLTVGDGTPPYTYAWSNGDTIEDIANLAAGIYSVTITDANGCTVTASASVTQPAASLSASAAVTQQVNCHAGVDGSIDLTVGDGTPPYAYVWSNGDTIEDIANLAAGTYSVIITDANGCTITASASVTQPAASLIASAAVTQQVNCHAGNDGSIDLTVGDGTPPYAYVWSNGATIEDIANLAAGTYSVTITDANGCTVTASASVTQPAAALNASAAVTQQVNCHAGNDGSVDLTVGDGTPPYTYVWSNGDTLEDISNLSAGTYTVTITDANGCTVTATASVTQPAAALNASTAVTQQVNCHAGNDGSIDLTVGDGTPPYAYVWSNGDTIEDISNLTAGTYTVTITDANGCTVTATATVTQPAAALNANATVSQQVNCHAGSDGSIDLTVQDGTAPYTYVWSTGEITEDISNLPAGTYTVTITDANGCTTTATVTITQPSASLAVTGSTTSSNCLYGITGSVSINPAGGTSPYAYSWSNGDTTQNLTGLPQGTYTVKITDVNGCETTGTYTVNDLSVFNANADGPGVLCAGDVTTLIADSIDNVTYQWYLDGTALAGENSPVLTTPTAGIYTVTITGPCGTFDSQPIEITVNPGPSVQIDPDVTICAGESTQLFASGGISYIWTPATSLDYDDVPNPVASPLQTTTYMVQVTNFEGCTATAQVMVTVECDTLIIPSGYSPNDDGINDAFVIKGIDHYPGNRIWIYNRWGNLIYKSNDYKSNWDGISNVSGIYIGKRVPAGTYFYVLDLNNNTKPLQGYIVLRY